MERVRLPDVDFRSPRFHLKKCKNLEFLEPLRDLKNDNRFFQAAKNWKTTFDSHLLEKPVEKST